MEQLNLLSNHDFFIIYPGLKAGLCFGLFGFLDSLQPFVADSLKAQHMAKTK